MNVDDLLDATDLLDGLDLLVNGPVVTQPLDVEDLLNGLTLVNGKYGLDD